MTNTASYDIGSRIASYNIGSADISNVPLGCSTGRLWEVSAAITSEVGCELRKAFLNIRRLVGISFSFVARAWFNCFYLSFSTPTASWRVLKGAETHFTEPSMMARRCGYRAMPHARSNSRFMADRNQHKLAFCDQLRHQHSYVIILHTKLKIQIWNYAKVFIGIKNFTLELENTRLTQIYINISNLWFTSFGFLTAIWLSYFSLITETLRLCSICSRDRSAQEFLRCQMLSGMLDTFLVPLEPLLSVSSARIVYIC